jgi:NADH-quinone oxidoreductase subunit G
MVVSLSPFADANLDIADVLLPIAPFSETSGTFVNAEGRVQSFHGVVKPLAETRPAWKVLRVLGTMLGIADFGFDSSDEVKAEALGDLSQLPQRLANVAGTDAVAVRQHAGPLERVADVPIYSTDSLVRRAAALQHTADAAAPVASLPTALWQQLGLQAGDQVRVSQGGASVVLPARLDATLAATAVRVPAGHAHTVALGTMFGAIDVVKA